MERYVVRANGMKVGVFFNEDKAWRWARWYKYDCNTQEDNPFDPEMTVEKEESK